MMRRKKKKKNPQRLKYISHTIKWNVMLKKILYCSRVHDVQWNLLSAFNTSSSEKQWAAAVKHLGTRSRSSSVIFGVNINPKIHVFDCGRNWSTCREPMQMQDTQTPHFIANVPPVFFQKKNNNEKRKLQQMRLREWWSSQLESPMLLLKCRTGRWREKVRQTTA